MAKIISIIKQTNEHDIKEPKMDWNDLKLQKKKMPYEAKMNECNENFNVPSLQMTEKF